MTIKIDSALTFIEFLLGLFTLIAVLSGLHWKLFASPKITKLIRPMQDNINIIARLLRDKYREEYERTEKDIEHENKVRAI